MCSPSASYSMFSSFKSGSFIPTNSNSFEPSVSAMPVYSSSECLRVFAMHSPLLYIAHLYVIILFSPVKRGVLIAQKRQVKDGKSIPQRYTFLL